MDSRKIPEDLITDEEMIDFASTRTIGSQNPCPELWPASTRASAPVPLRIQAACLHLCSPPHIFGRQYEYSAACYFGFNLCKVLRDS